MPETPIPSLTAHEVQQCPFASYASRSAVNTAFSMCASALLAQAARLAAILLLLGMQHAGVLAQQPILLAVPDVSNLHGDRGGLNFVSGVKVYVARTNAAGGVRGRQLVLVPVDGMRTSAQYAEGLRAALAAQPITALVGCVGEAHCAAAAQAAQRHRVPLIAPMSNTPAMARTANSMVFPMRPPLAREVEVLVRQIQQLGSTKVALLTELVPDAADAALQREFERQGIRVLPIAVTGDLPAALRRMADFGPHAAVLNMSVSSLQRFADANLTERPEWPQFLVTLANGNLHTMLTIFKGRAIGFTEHVPNPDRQALGLARDLDQDATRFGSSNAVSYEGMEGYLAARLLVEALKRTQAKTLDGPAIAEQLVRPGGWDLDGFRLDFSGDRAWGRDSVGIGQRSRAGFIIN